MFALIESCPDQRPGFGWTGKLISLATHAFVISAAVAFTDHVVAGAPYAPPVIPMIWEPSPVSPHAPPSRNRVPTIPAPECVCTSLPPVPVTVPVDIPPPGPSPVFDPGLPVTAAPGTPGIDPTGTPVIGNTPLAANLVDELPVLVSHPPIVYPELLRQAGIEGRVMIETVLDTLGHAEAAQTRVTKSGTDLFDREALRVVLASRYRAARVAGRAVRVRIAVPVNFTLHR